MTLLVVTKRALIILAAIGLGLLALLLAAWLFRDSLLTFAANRFLAPYQLSVHGVQGFRLSGSTATLQQVELALHDAGLRVLVRDLELMHYGPLSSGTEPATLEVGSLRLVPDDTLRAADNNRQDKELRVSNVLQLLQDLPPGRITVHGMTLPYAQEPVDIEVEARRDTLLARIRSGDLALHSQLTLDSVTASARLQTSIDNGSRTLSALQLHLTPTGPGYQLTGEGQIDTPALQALLVSRLPQLRPLPADIPQLNWDVSAYMEDAIATTREAELLVGLQADAAVTVPAQLLNGLGAIRLDLAERAVFAVTGLEHYLDAGASTETAPGIRLQEPTRLIGALAPSTFGAYRLQSGFEIQQLSVDLGATPGATLRVQTRQLDIAGPQDWLPRFDLTADIVLAEGLVEFDSALLLPEAPSDPGVVVQGHYDPARRSARISATLPALQLTPEAGHTLSAWVDGWPWPFDLVAGSLAAELELTWQAAAKGAAARDTSAATGMLSGTLAIELENASGYYGEYLFSGLDLPFAATIDTTAPIALSTPPLHLELALLDVGLTLENLAADIRLDGTREQLHIPAVRAETLGGQLHGEDLSYDFGLPRNTLTLQFSALRLEEMLALVEYDGVAATGAVSGALPVTVGEAGIEVEGGTLHADPPGGSIRYLDAGTDAGNVSLELVNQALGNYRFESLESTIDYRPDGELLFDMQLRGHNPDMNNGQRINLNLTLSDNIPVLLQSLQARRTVEDFIEARFQD